MKKVTIVVPVYNEAEVIASNLKTILNSGCDIDDVCISILVVDDGSEDQTALKVSLICKENPGRISLLSLTRNFGKEAAILAGLSHANSDAVIVMDSDLQHPPNLIPEMIKKWQDGAAVVECIKQERNDTSLMYQLSAIYFYRIFSLLSGYDLKNQSDYKLLDKKVVEEYCLLRERRRFFRGLIRWMSYKTVQIPFSVAERAGGETSWQNLTLIRFALSALISFSSLPLHLITFLGLITFVLGSLFGGIVLYQKFSGSAVDGFATVIMLNLLIGSILMFSLGLIGSYISNIYDEVKNRPIYFIDWQNSVIKLTSLNDNEEINNMK